MMPFSLDELRFRLAQSDFFLEMRELPLHFKRKASYSQHGEDLFLVEKVFKNRKIPGRYIDVGASHPIRISNTYLLYTMGWSGIIVEPISRLLKLQRRWRPRDTQVRCLIGEKDGVSPFYSMYPSVLSTASDQQYQMLLNKGHRLIESFEIEQKTIATLISEYSRDQKIDFMNIDIEGLDAMVAGQLSKLSDLELPHCLCIETNDNDAEIRVRTALQHRYQNIVQLGANLMLWNSEI
jgi:FkbM family methyltransferase